MKLMTKKIRHLLGISGGKDSAALAIYMSIRYPEIEMEYYFCDTGKELTETYDLIAELESFLGKEIIKLRAAENSPEEPFDHFLKVYNGYLPSSQARWCTKKLKLEPFEEFVGDDPFISYVAIRGDENREGYVSTKPNIQTIFPFRKNIWSLEVVHTLLSNENIPLVHSLYRSITDDDFFARVEGVILRPTKLDFLFSTKLNMLLDANISYFNSVVFAYLKKYNYPVGSLRDFPLLENSDIIKKQDVINLFTEYGVTYPKYYHAIDFESNGKQGKYARSRSGCYFCFFQQKIEWVWLYEQHPDLYKKAMAYEKDGYSWNENETLEELIQPQRIRQIKDEYLKKHKNNPSYKSNKLIDVLDEPEGMTCVNCFV
jgi:3'-phosphoadenosine 5'-phosphosulfate sulfotransferase (PAPS reductase)/FAD synthetase